MKPSLKQVIISTFAGASSLVLAHSASANTTSEEFQIKAAEQPQISAVQQEAEIIQVADLGDRILRNLERELERSINRSVRGAINGNGGRSVGARGNTERGADGLRYSVRASNIRDAGIYHYVTETRQGVSYPDNRGTQTPLDDYRIIRNGYGEWVGTCERVNTTREECHGPAYGAPVR